MSDIAFISQLSSVEKQIWLTEFAERLPDLKITLAEQMTKQQKLSCTIAIIANPLVADFTEFSQLQWCQSLWAGVDSLTTLFNPSNDKSITLANRNIKVSRLIDPQLSSTMSEAVLTWVLYFHREMHRYKIQQNRSVWQQRPYKVAGERRIGILGLGELGQASALRLVDNGFKVSGWSRQEKQIKGVTCLNGAKGLEAIAKQSDIIVCLLPLTNGTRGLIDRDFINFLPKNCCLINFSRGPIVNNNDLLAGLSSGQLAHAVLDVFDQEPLVESSQFWQHEQVTVLPHVSAPTHLKSATEIVANNITRYMISGVLPPCVDFNQGY